MLGKGPVTGLFPGMETQVLQDQHFPRFECLDGGLYPRPDVFTKSYRKHLGGELGAVGSDAATHGDTFLVKIDLFHAL